MEAQHTLVSLEEKMRYVIIRLCASAAGDPELNAQNAPLVRLIGMDHSFDMVHEADRRIRQAVANGTPRQSAADGDVPMPESMVKVLHSDITDMASGPGAGSCRTWHACSRPLFDYMLSPDV
jgi:hypothetical protein